jgi:hypothetical protein
MPETEIAPITLKTDEVLQFTRCALGELIHGWDMEYEDDGETRDEIRQAYTLLNLLWANSPTGKAYTAKLRNNGFLSPTETA